MEQINSKVNNEEVSSFKNAFKNTIEKNLKKV